MLIIFRATLNDKEPKWKLSQSRIGENPGLGYRPRPPREKIESTLIRFKQSHEKTYQHWVDDLKEFLADYKTNKEAGADQPVDCSTNPPPTEANKFCVFDYSRIITDNCTEDNQFGYTHGTPCILIKLNRIFDWMPETYGPEDEDDASLAPELTKAIKNVKAKESSSSGHQNRYIYVTCEGQHPVDKENIGALEYYPVQGINSYYFPFRNQDNYLSPFVLVQFTNPTRGVLINVECKAWAKNIKHDLTEREGSVHFEIAIDV